MTSLQCVPSNIPLLMKYLFVILKKSHGSAEPIKEIWKQVFKKQGRITSTCGTGEKKRNKSMLMLLVDMITAGANPPTWDTACKALQACLVVRSFLPFLVRFGPFP